MKEKASENADDVLHDLDQMTGLTGKRWSIEFAKKLGWSEEEIALYLGKKK